MDNQPNKETSVRGQFQDQEQILERLRRRYDQLEEELAKLEARLPQLGSDQPFKPPKKPK